MALTHYHFPVHDDDVESCWSEQNRLTTTIQSGLHGLPPVVLEVEANNYVELSSQESRGNKNSCSYMNLIGQQNPLLDNIMLPWLEYPCLLSLETKSL